jgi:DNA polymerase V
MNTFAESSSELQIYSIDEAFMKYPSSMPLDELIAIADNLRSKIKRWIGIPISIGIGPTKTLSKVANSLAKKNKAAVFNLCEGNASEDIFKSYPIGDVS